jgi:hypothetical protein
MEKVSVEITYRRWHQKHIPRIETERAEQRCDMFAKDEERKQKTDELLERSRQELDRLSEELGEVLEEMRRLIDLISGIRKAGK